MSDGKGKGRASRADNDASLESSGQSSQDTKSLLSRVAASASGLTRSTFATPSRAELNDQTAGVLANASKGQRPNVPAGTSGSAWAESSRVTQAGSYREPSTNSFRSGHINQHVAQSEKEFSTFLNDFSPLGTSNETQLRAESTHKLSLQMDAFGNHFTNGTNTNHLTPQHLSLNEHHSHPSPVHAIQANQMLLTHGINSSNLTSQPFQGFKNRPPRVTTCEPTGHYASEFNPRMPAEQQDYQMQLMLLEKQNQERLKRDRREQDSIDASMVGGIPNEIQSGGGSNHPRMENNSQMDLSMAPHRQPQGTPGQQVGAGSSNAIDTAGTLLTNGINPYHLTPQQFQVFQNNTLALQEYQIQLMLLEQQNQKFPKRFEKERREKTGTDAGTVGGIPNENQTGVGLNHPLMEIGSQPQTTSIYEEVFSHQLNSSIASTTPNLYQKSSPWIAEPAILQEVQKHAIMKSPPTFSTNYAGQAGFQEGIQSQDGLEVVKLLSSPSPPDFDPPRPSDFVDWNLSPTQLSILRKMTEKIFPEAPQPQHPMPPDHPLNLIPPSITTAESGTMPPGERLELWTEQWEDVLNSYQDDVWGDILPLVKEARQEVSDLANKEKTEKGGEAVAISEQPKALRRLGLILGHIRNL